MMSHEGKRAWQKRATIEAILDNFKRPDGTRLMTHHHIYDVRFKKGKLCVSMIRGTEIVQYSAPLVPMDSVERKNRVDDE